MLYSEDFLRELDTYPHRTVFVKITALDIDENPLETIEGRVSNGGSINIDGASKVRRTCSLTMLAEDVNIHDFYWGYKTKIKIAIGLENYIDASYPDTVWFEQGVFVITSFSCQLSTNGYNISLTAKDKMCLINGDVGGSMSAQTQFDSIEEETEAGDWVITKFPIKDIIRDSLHQYAGEPLHNIIINDLDGLGLELLEYRYDTPMYLMREPNSEEYFQAVIGGDMTCYLPGESEPTTLEDERIVYDQLIGGLVQEDAPTQVSLDPERKVIVCLAKISYGETAGYRLTDMIYPSDLILNVGDALTSVYDKIVSMLGNFEYFYAIDGRFIFQKKKTYLDSVWTPSVNNGDGVYYDGSQEESAYVFSGTGLLTAVSNSPNLNNLRNDFSVWGAREGAGDASIPVHMRYAIDEKPVYYKTFDDVVYYTDELPVSIPREENWKLEDWRELIYQMAKDYNKHNHDDDFSAEIARRGRVAELAQFYTGGRTGYEIYYIDLEGFWRQLYYPGEQRKADEEVKKNRVENAIDEATKTRLQKELDSFYTSFGEDNYREDGWNINVYEAPELLNYWIDFLDNGELAQYSVKNIGPRSKSVNDTSIKSIYYRDTPNIIFLENGEERDESKSGYRYFQASGLESMFSISSQGKSAKDEIDSLVYDYSYAQESVSITAIPIYYLEPNSRITINDDKTGIQGDYVVSKITIPLTYNGIMTLSATKAPERLQ